MTAGMFRPLILVGGFLAAFAAAGCNGSSTPSNPGGGNGTGGAGTGGTPTASPAASASPAPTSTSSSVPLPAPNAAITVHSGFTIGVLANVGGAREMAMLPDGDLLVGTGGGSVIIVPNADAASAPGTPATFATVGDNPAEGVAYGNGKIYVATQHHLWMATYTAGMRSATFTSVANFRQGSPTPNSDGDVHTSASVAVTGSNVYIGIGSGCNACVEVDPTRATVQRTNLDGSGMTTYARRIRNAIAVTVNPNTGSVWVGGAGQDNLPAQHPYEYFDALTSHGAGVDYGWPDCEENHHAYTTGANCTNTVQPLVEFPAYSTLIGAAFYPKNPTGAYAFPSAYRGGVFVAAHGSWHTSTADGHHIAPRVSFVAMNGDTPVSAVNWNDPTTQSSDFITGFQNNANGDNRVGRATGVAVGNNGSLFVADDQAGAVYRIRPQ